MSNTNKILCIPRMETSIAMEFIRKSFEKAKLGSIKRIVEIPHKNNTEFKRVIIYMNINNYTPNSQMMESRFKQKKDIKLIYQDPWYWKIVEAKIDEKQNK